MIARGGLTGHMGYIKSSLRFGNSCAAAPGAILKVRHGEALRGPGKGTLSMLARLVALDEGPDIPVDRAMLVVGRHPRCDARLDSIRVSRQHCCMTAVDGELEVRDLGSTNGIRINGQRVETGRLRPGDELSIAHIRYRLDGGGVGPQDATMVDPLMVAAVRAAVVECDRHEAHRPPTPPRGAGGENPLAAAVRDLLPASLAEKCRIQVIVQMRPGGDDPSLPPPPAAPHVVTPMVPEG